MCIVPAVSALRRNVNATVEIYRILRSLRPTLRLGDFAGKVSDVSRKVAKEQRRKGLRPFGLYILCFSQINNVIDLRWFKSVLAEFQHNVAAMDRGMEQHVS